MIVLVKLERPSFLPQPQKDEKQWPASEGNGEGEERSHLCWPLAVDFWVVAGPGGAEVGVGVGMAKVKVLRSLTSESKALLLGIVHTKS